MADQSNDKRPLLISQSPERRCSNIVITNRNRHHCPISVPRTRSDFVSSDPGLHFPFYTLQAFFTTGASFADRGFLKAPRNSHYTEKNFDRIFLGVGPPPPAVGVIPHLAICTE